ncbi:MAG: isocitrate/isopropylmalate dehydrogenase family protein [Clostridia bacterium]|nr:isocitrate/isopropylmalate dehydrogenase family protein [Clostridia bacterium]
MSMEAYVNEAVSKFRKLLEEQIERSEKMRTAPEKKDFSKTQKIVVGTIDGDGIGPILMAQANRVLKVLLRDELASGRVEIREISGLTIENRIALGKSVPDDTMNAIKECDVLLKGPTTTPKGGSMESANVTLRRELDLYANVRPVTIPEENCDWTFFRENTEGEYVLGSRGIEIPDILTMDFKVTTEPGTKRIARTAYEFARNNGKKRVSIVTKANIMKKTDGSFSAICHEIAKEYPEIETDEWYIDIMTANLVNPRIRNQFEVFLLPNLYGDIITDEAAQLQGGVGTAGSANTGDRYAMFEAIHGSAPRMVEEGIQDYANPSSLFRAIELMLRHIAMPEKADALSNALTVCSETERRVIVTGNKDGATAGEFTDYVIETLIKANA